MFCLSFTGAKFPNQFTTVTLSFCRKKSLRLLFSVKRVSLLFFSVNISTKYGISNHYSQQLMNNLDIKNLPRKTGLQCLCFSKTTTCRTNILVD